MKLYEHWEAAIAKDLDDSGSDLWAAEIYAGRSFPTYRFSSHTSTAGIDECRKR